MRIVDAARVHGIADEDMLHAVRTAITGFERGELMMLIGAARDGTLLEAGILGAGSDDPVIVHAMKLRARFYKYLPSGGW